MNMKKLIESMDHIEECGMTEMPAAMPAPEMDKGNPVTMSVNLNASGKEHVDDLINMMKNAGMGAAEPVSAKTLSPRMDMERLSGIMDEPGMEDPNEEMEPVEDEIDTDEGYDNEPDAEYQDHKYMTKDLSGGLNREKKAYAAAQDGDNAMAVEAIKAQLMAALSEKKSKPDFLDVDKDGDKKEPMKKALKDKGSKPKKGEVPAQFKKKNESALDEISSDMAKRYTKNAKVDRDNTDDILKRDGSTNDWKANQELQKRNAKRTKGMNRAKKRMQ